MNKTLGILFVLLSILSFVAVTYPHFGIMQFLMLGVFVLLTAFVLALRNRNIDSVMLVFFSLGLIDSLIIFIKAGLKLSLVFYGLVNLIGFIIPMIGTDVYRRRTKAIPKKPLEVYETEEPEKKENGKKNGKNFVASKTGKVYHKANCNWVNNIRNANRVWFKTADQARRAGYKAHKCD